MKNNVIPTLIIETIITADEKRVDYYEIIVTDFAGNRTKKKLTSQYSLLTWFHTSIDRSSYN